MLRRWIRLITPELFRRFLIQKVAGATLAERDSIIESLLKRVQAAETSLSRAAADLAASVTEIENLRADLENAESERAQLSKKLDEQEQIIMLEATTRDRLSRTHERAMQDASRAASRALNDSVRRERTLRACIRQAMTLLRMNSPTASQGAYELLYSADSSTRASGDSAFLFDIDSETRSRRLLTLSQTEVNTGRWTALLRTDYAAKRLARYGSTDGYLLVNDTRTQNNIGCRATTRMLVDELASHGLHIAHSISLAELVEMVNQLRAEAGVSPNEENFDLYADLIHTSEIFAACREIAEHTRGVVINGEGSIYDTQPKGLVLLALAHVLSERMHKRVAMVNYSADLTEPVMEGWARFGLPALTWSSFREPVSTRRLPSGFPSLRGPGWFPDAAFLVDPRPTDSGRASELEIALGSDSIFETQIKQPYVVLTGSSSLYRRDRAVTDIRAAFTQLCVALRDEGLQPVLWAADKQDRLLLRPTAVELRLPYLSASVPLQTARAVLSNAVCMLSGRWHASILASRWGCPPILGDATFFKTRALHEMLGLETPMVEYRELDQSLSATTSTIAGFANAENSHRTAIMECADTLAAQARAGIAETARVLLDASL